MSTLSANPTVLLMADALQPLSADMLAWEFGRRVTLEARGFSDDEIKRYDESAAVQEQARREQKQ